MNNLEEVGDLINGGSAILKSVIFDGCMEEIYFLKWKIEKDLQQMVG